MLVSIRTRVYTRVDFILNYRDGIFSALPCTTDGTGYGIVLVTFDLDVRPSVRTVHCWLAHVHRPSSCLQK